MQSNAATFSYHQREIVGAGRTAYAGREERFLIIVPRKCNTVDQSFQRSWDVCKRFKEGTKRWGWDALVVMRGLERSWRDTPKVPDKNRGPALEPLVVRGLEGGPGGISPLRTHGHLPDMLLAAPQWTWTNVT